MNANVWEDIYENLIGIYPNIACVDIDGSVGVILKLPNGDAAGNLVSHMKLTVNGVGVCAHILTYYKGISADEVQRLLQGGMAIPDEGSHVVVLKRVVGHNLLQIANGLGAEFSDVETCEIESVGSLIGSYSIHMIGKRFLAFDVPADLARKDNFNEIINTYREVMWHLFRQKPSISQTIIDIKCGRRLWFGDMQYGC